MAWLPGINKISWDQVGRVTKPGRYQYKFGWLTVGSEDLSIWEKYPNVLFTLVRVQAEEGSPAEEYRLGTFELL
jgi:hypothetical protein